MTIRQITQQCKMNSQTYIITFDDYDRTAWIRTISDIQKVLKSSGLPSQEVVIRLCGNFTVEKMESLHRVLLACLIQLLIKHGYVGHIEAEDSMLKHLTDDLHILPRFSPGIRLQDYIDTTKPSLWKVASECYPMYSAHIAQYFKNTYLCKKDISIFKVVLDELYANIADHSQGDDMAYSYISYDDESRMIDVAFCDFGIGIAESLRRAGLNIDSNYIMHATQAGVTAQSNPHNKGYGLDTVVSCVAGSDNVLTIISGNELFVAYGTRFKPQTWKWPYYIDGTLVFFSIPADAFDDVDYEDYGNEL